MLSANQERKPTRQKGTQRKKEPEQVRGERKAARQAHKPTTRGPPPTGRAKEAAFLITNSRQKISKKSPWVDLKKFSEKFFVGMFRGKEKPLALSQGKGVLTNENREISNLAMQITKKQKH